VAAALFLTVEFDIRFGKERLAGVFLSMLPPKGEGVGSGLGLGRSLIPLAELVEKIVGHSGGINPNEMME
jgi:hypothetical protein